MNTMTIMGIEFATQLTKADKVFVSTVGALAGFSTVMWARRARQLKALQEDVLRTLNRIHAVDGRG